VRKALPLSEIKLASLQGLPGTLAIFNVREGSVPSDNFSMLASKWHTTHQKPPIFPASGTTELRLVFENLTGRNGDAPLLGMAHKVFGMDRTLPTYT
jgi:hypothetical protein